MKFKLLDTVVLDMKRPGIGIIVLSAAAACNAGSAGSRGSNGSGGNGPPEGTSGLQTLLLTEAPAATQTFYWGDVTVTSPGFFGDGPNLLTLSLDAQYRIRYFSFRNGPALNEIFGDEPEDFPLAGSKHVDIGTNSYDVTVDDTGTSTPLHFSTRRHVTGGPAPTDLLETTDGTRTSEDDGWTITYSMVGTLWAAPIDKHATGVVFAGGPPVTAPGPGKKSFWSGPVELTAGGWAGDPLDRLTVALDERGAIFALMFDLFSSGSATSLNRPADFVLADFILKPHRSDGPRDMVVTFDTTVPPTDQHFVSRYRVVAPSLLHDFTAGIDGTRNGNQLVVRYFLNGKVGSTPVEAHAAGTLTPIDDPLIAPGGSGGMTGTGGSLGTGGLTGTGTGGLTGTGGTT